VSFVATTIYVASQRMFIVVSVYFVTDSVRALRPIQWVAGPLSVGVERPWCEADHSPPSSAEVRECVELYLHSPIRVLLT
jgi:hypothetical protein